MAVRAVAAGDVNTNAVGVGAGADDVSVLLPCAVDVALNSWLQYR